MSRFKRVFDAILTPKRRVFSSRYRVFTRFDFPRDAKEIISRFHVESNQYHQTNSNDYVLKPTTLIDETNAKSLQTIYKNVNLHDEIDPFELNDSIFIHINK